MFGKTTESGTPYRRPYRFVMAALLLLIPFCTMIPYVAPAVYMMGIMDTFQVDMGMAGLTMTIQLGATGICMFVGSFVQDKLGVQKSIVLGIWAMALGNIMAFLSPGIAVFLIARFVAGFGQGVYTSVSNTSISTWFEGKERTYMLTLSSVFSSIALAISYTICIPLSNLFGSWQRVFGVYGIAIAVIALLWTFFGKSSPEEIAVSPGTGTGYKQGGGSLARALKEKEYWKLAICVALITVANTTIATYLPTYLTTERGLDAAVATTVSSMNSLFGIAGSLLGGILCAHLWRRKPTLVVSGVLYVLTGFLLTICTSGSLILILALAAGAIFYIPVTTQSTVMIEAKQPFDPTILSGAACMVFGIGQLLCVVVPFLFNTLTEAFSMTAAYRVFFGLCNVSVVAALMMKETGKKA